MNQLTTMSDFIPIYTKFNNVEGAIWIAIAAGLPFFAATPTKGKRIAVATASFGFLVFGATDFMEAATQGTIPMGLWALKIASAGIILASRFGYRGWNQFRMKDPLFLYGLFCLIAVSAIIAMQLYFECHGNGT